MIISIAADSKESLSKVLRQLDFIQEELLKRKLISLDDLTDEQIENLSEKAFLEDWIDGQEVMQKLKISPGTLQTLRSNGTIPYTRIGHKLYYLKQDIERILRNNYVMYNIRKRYGEDN
ncbi:MAG: helix-turn-helix domain-containing protein [Bacteroidales bacterium]|nr:helix-turn-helix domain-containing protein [Bacteroidales bacterium]